MSLDDSLLGRNIFTPVQIPLIIHNKLRGPCGPCAGESLGSHSRRACLHIQNCIVGNIDGARSAVEQKLNARN